MLRIVLGKTNTHKECRKKLLRLDYMGNGKIVPYLSFGGYRRYGLRGYKLLELVGLLEEILGKEIRDETLDKLLWFANNIPEETKYDVGLMCMMNGELCLEIHGVCINKKYYDMVLGNEKPETEKDAVIANMLIKHVIGAGDVLHGYSFDLDTGDNYVCFGWL